MTGSREKTLSGFGRLFDLVPSGFAGSTRGYRETEPVPGSSGRNARGGVSEPIRSDGISSVRRLPGRATHRRPAGARWAFPSPGVPFSHPRLLTEAPQAPIHSQPDPNAGTAECRMPGAGCRTWTPTATSPQTPPIADCRLPSAEAESIARFLNAPSPQAPIADCRLPIAESTRVIPPNLTRPPAKTQHPGSRIPDPAPHDS